MAKYQVYHFIQIDISSSLEGQSDNRHSTMMDIAKWTGIKYNLLT